MEDAPDKISEDTSSLPTIIKAGSPFDDPLADVVLRSCDRVDFHVHKLILSLSSSIFKSMFTLPQLPPPASSASTPPVVDMIEASVVLGGFLLACYPPRSDTLDSPYMISKMDHDGVRLILEAARKYEILAVDTSASMRILDFVEEDPLKAYATASRFGLQTVADTAARRLLKYTIADFPSRSSMNDMTAVHLYDVIRYHQDCGRAAYNAVKEDILNEDFRSSSNLDYIVVSTEDDRGRPPCDCFRKQNEGTTRDNYMPYYWALPCIWKLLQTIAEAVEIHPDPLVVLSLEEVQPHPRWGSTYCTLSDYDGCQATEPLFQLPELYIFLMDRVTKAIDKVSPPRVT